MARRALLCGVQRAISILRPRRATVNSIQPPDESLRRVDTHGAQPGLPTLGRSIPIAEE
jgi:hypothetical protein